MFRAICAIAVFFVCQSLSNAEEWPNWRGPNRNDLSTEHSGYRAGAWLAEQPLWVAEVGEGSSSPIVVAGVVYSFTWRKNQEVLSALDATSGKELWSTSYNAPRYGREAEGDQGLYSGPSSTPEFDAETGLLFTLGTDGALRAWNVGAGKGRVQPKNVWTIELYERYQVPQRPKVNRSSRRDYGYTSSPLALKQALIVEVGAATGTVIGFDKTTGKELWRSQATEPPGHNGGPVPITIDGTPCVAVHTFSGLLVMRIDSENEGKTVAQVPWQTEYANNIATVAVHNNSVLLTSSYNQNRIARFDISMSGGAKQVWETHEASKVCSPLVHKGSVYWAWQRLFCLDFETGKVRWSGGRIGDPGSCIVTADDRLIVWSGRGELSLVDTAVLSPTEYRELHKREIGRDDAWPHLTFADGRLYCKDRQGHLTCLEVKPDPNSKGPAEENPIVMQSGQPAKWKVAASHNQKDVKSVIDGDVGSRWSSDAQQEPGMWFAIDFGAVTKVSKLKLDCQRSPEDFPAAYAVSVSTDGRVWSAPIASGQGEKAMTEIVFPAGKATRYLRITQTGTSSRWWSIHEPTIE